MLSTRTVLRSTTSLSRPLQRLQSTTRHFSNTPAIMVKDGDSIPSVELFESNPSEKVNLANELSSGNGLIIFVPAAFSPGCSDHHIPGYIARPDKLEKAGKTFVVSVNDAFVMNAWKKSMDPDKSSGIRFLGDADGSFTKAMDLDFDASALLGNVRSKRAAVQTKDGKVSKVAIEPDNIGHTVSSAEKFLA